MQFVESRRDKSNIDRFLEAEARMRMWRLWRRVLTILCIPIGVICWAALCFPDFFGARELTIVEVVGWVPFGSLVSVFLFERIWVRRLLAAAEPPTRSDS